MAGLPTLWSDRAAALVMYALLPLAPFAAALIARDATYLRHFGASLRSAVRHVQGQQQARLASRFAAALRAGWPPADVITGSCTHCGACCLHQRCIFLRMEGGRSSCRIYGTPFFRRLVCAEYPRTAEDIARYACPSFTARSRTTTAGAGMKSLSAGAVISRGDAAGRSADTSG